MIFEGLSGTERTQTRLRETNYMDSPGHNPNGQSRYKSQTQTSPNKQHFDTAYHNLLVKLSSEPPETEEQALITRLLLTPQAEGELAKHHLFSKRARKIQA